MGVTEDNDVVASPNNRSGRPDRFFHFLIGYFAPTLHAIEDFELASPLAVQSVGELDRLWGECVQPRVTVIPAEDFESVSHRARVRLRARGFDSPHAHVQAPWPAVRRAALRSLGIDPAAERDDSVRRILIVERAMPSGEAALGNRSGAARRSIPNLDAIAAALSELGEVTVRTLEGLPLTEQVRLFRQADAVVAQHGASSANLLWSRPGTRFVEVVTPEKANVLTGFYDSLRIDTQQVAQAEAHADVDVTAVVAAVDADGAGEGKRKKGARTPIPWSARAWQRHQDLAIDETDSGRWLGQLDRWARPLDSDGEQPVFVLSSSWRAGSTLLQRLLMSGGEALIWGEPFGQRDPLRQMTDMYLPFREGYPRPDHFHDHRVQGESFDPAESWVANLYPSVPDLEQAHRAFLTELLAEPARRAGFRRWGLKEVRVDAFQAAYLRLLFPDARLVFLIRNPYDAYRSYRVRGGWYDRFPDRPVFDAEAFGQHWRRLTESFLAQAGTLDAMLVRFEDLTRDPAVLPALATYTGLSVDPRVLEVRRRGKDEAVPQPIRPKEIRSLEAVAGELAASLGYPAPAD
ncbi:MAG: glycosyltransferase 61 family protein [Candidatus Nanopelagicales bacterium]